MRKQSVILYILGLLMIAVIAFVAFLAVSAADSRSASGAPSEKPRLDLPDNIPWNKIPWRDFPENFPWDEVPWEEMPEDTDWENVPWNSIPWDKLPDDIPADVVPWEDIPWDDLPEDFPYEKFDWANFPWNDVPLSEIPWEEVPWDELPPDMPWREIPWENIPWSEMPKNFPWNDVPLSEIPWEEVPWDDLPPDMPWTEIPWKNIPWSEMPKNFPWSTVPWADIPEDFPWDKVPWSDLPEDFPWLEFSNGGCPHIYTGGENGDGWAVTNYPTCTDMGTQTRVCLICRVPETKDIPSTGVHIFEKEICTMCSKHRIVLESGSISREYNGEPLKTENCNLVSGELITGHKIEAVYAQTNTVGIADNIFTARIKDFSGADVTDLYVIEYKYGTLELLKRDITITTDSAKKTYDGSALTCKTYKSEGLAEGDRIVITFGKGQTVRGESQNVAAVRILDSSGADVTANYSVNLVFGTLTVE